MSREVADVPDSRVTWFDLPAADIARAWRFYGEVFGWTPEAAERDDKMTGAINGTISQRAPDLDAPRLVIRVDDIPRAVDRILAAGGSLVSEPVDLPDIGMSFAVFADTEGNRLNVVSMADTPSR